MVGPQCCENPPRLDPSCGAGHVEQFAGLQTYITGNQHSQLALLFAADAYGNLLINYTPSINSFIHFHGIWLN